MTGQDGLFPLPPDVPRPAPATAPGGPAPVRWTRIRPLRRTLCDHCVLAIHELGVGVAPYPAGARWRRTAGDLVAQLCEAHKQAAAEGDGKPKR